MRITYNEAACIYTTEDFQNICNMYHEIISLGMKEKIKSLENDFAKMNYDENILEEEYQEMCLFKYRMDLLLICCLSEVWEQNLFTLLNENIKNLKTEKSSNGNVSSKSKDSKKAIENKLHEIKNNNDYGKVKELYKELFKFDIDKYEKIEEMRYLVNAIKHGLGSSLDKLKRSKEDSLFFDSDILKYDENEKEYYKKEIEVTNTTLNSKVLNVDGKLEEYCHALKEFWLDLNATLYSGR